MGVTLYDVLRPVKESCWLAVGLQNDRLGAFFAQRDGEQFFLEQKETVAKTLGLQCVRKPWINRPKNEKLR